MWVTIICGVLAVLTALWLVRQERRFPTEYSDPNALHVTIALIAAAALAAVGGALKGVGKAGQQAVAGGAAMGGAGGAQKATAPAPNTAIQAATASAPHAQQSPAAQPFGTGYMTPGEYGMSTPAGEIGMTSAGGVAGGAPPLDQSWMDKIKGLLQSPGGQVARGAFGGLAQGLGGGGSSSTNVQADPLAQLVQASNDKRRRLAGILGNG